MLAGIKRSPGPIWSRWPSDVATLHLLDGNLGRDVRSACLTFVTRYNIIE